MTAAAGPRPGLRPIPDARNRIRCRCDSILCSNSPPRNCRPESQVADFYAVQTLICAQGHYVRGKTDLVLGRAVEPVSDSDVSVTRPVTHQVLERMQCGERRTFLRWEFRNACARRNVESPRQRTTTPQETSYLRNRSVDRSSPVSIRGSNRNPELKNCDCSSAFTTLRWPKTPFTCLPCDLVNALLQTELRARKRRERLSTTIRSAGHACVREGAKGP